jgi:hypothetical protein
MLARSGPLPTSGDYAFEVKWDGFRAIVSTEGHLRVRSRRGWDMSEHVLFLADLPLAGVFDGELVALDPDGKPDFPGLCDAVLLRRKSAPLTFIIFDVLSVEGERVTSQPHSERRLILEDLQLHPNTGSAIPPGVALDAPKRTPPDMCTSTHVCLRERSVSAGAGDEHLGRLERLSPRVCRPSNEPTFPQPTCLVAGPAVSHRGSCRGGETKPAAAQR